MNTKLPVKVQIVKAFIEHDEKRLTAAEIANYSNLSIQSIYYHLKDISESILQTEENKITKKKHYYINDFFLNNLLRKEARKALQPFIQFFIDYFHFSDEMSDKDIEKDIVEFIHIITWLFSDDFTENHFEKSI